MKAMSTLLVALIALLGIFFLEDKTHVLSKGFATLRGPQRIDSGVTVHIERALIGDDTIILGNETSEIMTNVDIVVSPCGHSGFRQVRISDPRWPKHTPLFGSLDSELFTRLDCVIIQGEATSEASQRQLVIEMEIPLK